MYVRTYMMHTLYPRLVAVDTETTTQNPKTARIVEITIAVLDDHLEVTRSLTQRINPQVPIPAAATALHGISDADVQAEPVFRDVARRVRAMVDNVAIVAYNARFDTAVLHREFRMAGLPGLPARQRLIDPFLQFARECPRTLSAASDHYLGKPHPAPHKSAADVTVMLEVLREQVRGTSLLEMVRPWQDWAPSRGA